jgi:hypothetical protein
MAQDVTRILRPLSRKLVVPMPKLIIVFRMTLASNANRGGGISRSVVKARTHKVASSSMYDKILGASEMWSGPKTKLIWVVPSEVKRALYYHQNMQILREQSRT